VDAQVWAVASHAGLACGSAELLKRGGRPPGPGKEGRRDG
jgi:hypothetical protein